MILTYINLKLIQKKLPKINPADYEQQFWISFLIKKLGIEKGLFIAFIIVTPVMFFITNKIGQLNLLFIGIYSVILFLHFNALSSLLGKVEACDKCGRMKR